MGFIDKYITGTDDVQEEVKQGATVSDDVEQALEQKDEQLQQMRQELRKREQNESARTAQLEERVHEQEQERKELHEQLQDQQQQMQQMQQNESSSSVASPPPDDRLLQGKPVVSIDGNKVFGKFKNWSSERDKVGILVQHPKNDSQYQKVGWADNIRELVVDPGSLRHKEVIITKMDAQGEMSDFVSIHRHKDEVKEKRRLEEKANRLGSENHELQQMIQKLRRTNQKLITQLSLQQMNGKPDNGAKDLTISKLRKERNLDKQRMENLTHENRHKDGRVKEVIDQYEQTMGEGLGDLTKDNTEQSIEDVGYLLRSLFGEMGMALDELSQEQQEDLISSITGGGAGGAINIKEE